MIISAEHLSQEALQGLIEAFITREGTDYGMHEVSLEDKVQQIKALLRTGDVLIVFDAGTESTTLMTQQQYQAWSMG
jgi:uncharacterized protein YheU (UPF0270 family)